VCEARRKPLTRYREHVALADETRVQIWISKQNSSDLFACKWLRAPATSND